MPCRQSTPPEGPRLGSPKPTDVTVPGRSGAELYRELADEKPSLATLLVSGHLPGDPHADLAATAGHFLQKPFTMDEILEAVREALDAPVDS
jgi:FixJ family two-component response regulator